MPGTMAGVCETKDCGQFHSSACPLPSQALNNLLHNLQLTVARPGICSDAADVMRHTSVQQSVRRYKMHDACTFHSVQPLLFSPLCNTDNILDTQAYWPFHRMSCHKNEFADAVEEAEPKFAGWMRSHGKLAVLKDDEIERLERAGAATMSVSRAEVMDSMYNRLEPKPKEPSYSAEELAAMRLSREATANQAYSLPQHQLAWQQIQPAEHLGQDCATYKWSQSQTEVDVYVQIPTQIRRHEIVVQCTPDKLLIKLGEKVILNGQLFGQIKREDSMWLLENTILHLTMLKRNRRGNYANQCTNADTFWKSVLKSAPHQERLTMAYPPDKYYALPFEGCDSSHLPSRLTSSHAASQGQLVSQRVQARNQQ